MTWWHGNQSVEFLFGIMLGKYKGCFGEYIELSIIHAREESVTSLYYKSIKIISIWFTLGETILNFQLSSDLVIIKIILIMILKYIIYTFIYY